MENAHHIISGEPLKKGGKTDDFFFLEADGDAAQKLVCDLVTTRLPRSYQFDPVKGYSWCSAPRSSAPPAPRASTRSCRLCSIRPGKGVLSQSAGLRWDKSDEKAINYEITGNMGE